MPPDLLATADDGRIAVLELNSPVHKYSGQPDTDRLESLVDEYGGEQHVSGILVTAATRDCEIRVTIQKSQQFLSKNCETLQ